VASFVAFQPVPGKTSRLAVARACLERSKGFAVAGETADAVKFLRLNGSGTAPASSPRGWLVSAGCWHHPECGLDDPGALLALLEARGAAACDGLDGCFAVAWQDRASGELTVVPDALGRLHVYCCEAPEGVYVSTSPVAVAAAARCAPDPLAAWELLAVGTLYEERSPFQGVRRLAGGFRHRFAHGRFAGTEPCAGWLLPPHGPTGGGRLRPEEWAEGFLASLRPFLPEGVRPLPDLTGGLDSRLLIGFLLEAGLQFDVTVTGGARDPDVRSACELARRLGLTMHVIPRETGMNAMRSFPAVLEAARRVEGVYDAAEYAAIAAVHAPHSRQWDLSINGSGGELIHWYSWNTAHNRATGSPEQALLHRFTGLVRPVPFLDPRLVPDPAAHFRGAFGRALADRAGDPIGSRLDHLYLHLRMQCWQGTLATATSEFWPSVAPLLLRGPLQLAYRVADEDRFTYRLLHALFQRMPEPIRACPLASGSPPLPPGPLHFWRRLPGVVRGVSTFATRVKRRLLRGRPDPTAAESVRQLMASGGSDWLRPREMALAPLCDGAELARFVAEARAGRVGLATLGRLIALERALREAARG